MIFEGTTLIYYLLQRNCTFQGQWQMRLSCKTNSGDYRIDQAFEEYNEFKIKNERAAKNKI